MRNKGLKILITVFAVLTIVDLVSTLKLGYLVKYLEANPFYQYIGLIGIFLLNVLFILIIYWFYKKSKNILNRYITMNLLTTICIGKLLAIINNIKIGLNPPTLQQAVQITTTQKTAVVASLGFSLFLPYIIGIVAFIFYSMDQHIIIK